MEGLLCGKGDSLLVYEATGAGGMDKSWVYAPVRGICEGWVTDRCGYGCDTSVRQAAAACSAAKGLTSVLLGVRAKEGGVKHRVTPSKPALKTAYVPYVAV